MNITKLSTGSKGNAILIGDGRSQLLLDAGLPFRKLAQRIIFSQVAGILITHEHMDHARAVRELLRRSYPVFMSKGTWQALSGMDTLPVSPVFVQHMRAFELASWRIMPFEINHDVAEPLGYLLESKATGERAVYIVDSAFVNFKFDNITHWIIEANYDEENMARSADHEALKHRIERSHMSFEEVQIFFRTSNLSRTKEIHLIHLSDRNSNEPKFVRMLQEQTGVPVYT
ncbi:MAG TPA: MBL fold metallo-hydrolase [Balneolaceae bacterium]|nr:MBL fold metallo-hydrolase [Balneolaceae bacterium]